MMAQPGRLHRTKDADEATCEVRCRHSDVEAAADGHALQPRESAPRSVLDDQQQLALLVH